MRRYLRPIVALGSLAALICSAQNNPDNAQKTPPPVLRATTRLVILDVVATDAGNHPISDLKREDFVVTENSEPQTLANFSFHRGGEVATLAPASGNIISNSPQYKGNSCLNVILLDAINTDFSNHAYAQDMLIKYLETDPVIQPTAVFALEGRLKLLHDFTTDTKALRDALAHYNPGGPTHIPDVYAMASPFERRGTYQPTGQGRQAAFYGMEYLAQSLAGYPGRKNLIWISEGFPVNLFPDVLMGDGVMTSEDYSPLVEKIADDLMASQIALYPISAAGVSQTSQFSAATAMSSMAQRTGGKTFFNRNDIDFGVRTSLDDGSTYYTLEYYPQSRKWDGKFRRIQVKVERPGVKLHYREGYYGLGPMRESDSMIERDFSNALGSFSPSLTAVLFQAAVAPPVQNKVVVTFGIDAHTLQFDHLGDGHFHAVVDCVAWAYPEKGEPVRAEGNVNANLEPQVYQQIMQSYFPCKRTLELKPGRYTLRLAVLDRTSGLIGSTATRITIPEQK